MIIVLNGADFSQNNIGKVIIEREVSPEILALLANYSKTLSLSQQLAVEDFLTDLKKEGIYDRMTGLYIPLLAANVNEAFFNIITKKNTTPTLTGGYLLDSNGLRLATTASRENTTGITEADGLKMPVNGDCHVSCYAMENIVGSYYLGSNTKSETFWLSKNTSNSFLMGSNSNGCIATADPNSFVSRGLKVGSNNGNSVNSAKLNFSGIPQISSDMLGQGLTSLERKLGSLLLGGYAVNSTNIFSTSRYGMMSIGQSLTEDQMAYFSTMADKFISNF